MATLGVRRSDITMEIAGSASVGWTDDDADTGRRGELFIGRQGGAIAGGTNEMQRNVIAERVLGLPREQTVDRDVPCLADVMGVDRFIAVGYSMGGPIAQLTWYRHRPQVAILAHNRRLPQAQGYRRDHHVRDLHSPARAFQFGGDPPIRSGSRLVERPYLQRA